MMEFSNPVAMFRRASVRNETLLEQTANDVYYVVASAYDHKSAAANRRVLLWRTRMTVAAQGVSQDQTLPTLVMSAAPYFGKDMPEAELLTRRTREGTVEITLGGRIETMDRARPRAEAVAVRDGRIVAVGADADARERIGPRTRVIALRGFEYVGRLYAGRTGFEAPAAADARLWIDRGRRGRAVQDQLRAADDRVARVDLPVAQDVAATQEERAFRQRRDR